MTGLKFVAGGLTAGLLSCALAGPASAQGLFDFFLPTAPQPAYQASVDPATQAPLQEGRSVAVADPDAQVAAPAALSTRTVVADPTHERPGTITIDTRNRLLYLSQGDGTAIRYGVGVGRDGFRWSGTAMIARKAEWPTWTPPAEMIKRRPDIPHFMKGGIENPLGARAMYLYNGKGDTGYRIHGTNEPDTIGQAVSSGCIRMMNQDVIDLYGRVKPGTRVVVLPG
jgi:lipoprotein-anchoring transpeptidase ErfK/SrfK